MTLQEIADLCGVGFRTVQRWIDKMTCHSDAESGTAESILQFKVLEVLERTAGILDRMDARLERSGNFGELAGNRAIPASQSSPRRSLPPIDHRARLARLRRKNESKNENLAYCGCVLAAVDELHGR
jgi:hypothetical protein